MKKQLFLGVLIVGLVGGINTVKGMVSPREEQIDTVVRDYVRANITCSLNTYSYDLFAQKQMLQDLLHNIENTIKREHLRQRADRILKTSKLGIKRL